MKINQEKKMNDSQYYEGNPQYQIVQYDGPVE